MNFNKNRRGGSPAGCVEASGAGNGPNHGHGKREERRGEGAGRGRNDSGTRDRERTGGRIFTDFLMDFYFLIHKLSSGVSVNYK